MSYPTPANVLPLDDLVIVRQRLRSEGRTVVFSNGCFDLLHLGHIDYLEQARLLGDVLLVAINTDTSVQRGKGPSRPIIPEAERAELLAALECVDYVTFFDDDTPKAVIDALIPDVLVKGADWPLDQIVGRDTVEAHGGKVLNIPLLEGHSTSGIIAKVQGGE